MKKYKTKSFILASGTKNGGRWSIRTDVLETSGIRRRGGICIAYRESVLKVKRKGNAARRKLGYHEISFPLKVPFEWHHVNEKDVVAVPYKIHNNFKHKLGDGNRLEGVIG